MIAAHQAAPQAVHPAAPQAHPAVHQAAHQAVHQTVHHQILLIIILIIKIPPLRMILLPFNLKKITLTQLNLKKMILIPIPLHLHQDPLLLNHTLKMMFIIHPKLEELKLIILYLKIWELLVAKNVPLKKCLLQEDLKKESASLKNQE